MTIKVKSGDCHCYLLFLTVVALSIFIIGCAERLPEIDLGLDRHPLGVSGSGSPVYQLTPFLAHSPRHTVYARFVSDYLGERLAEKQQVSAPKSDDVVSKEEKSLLSLTGKVKISTWSARVDTSITAVKTEITFEIRDQNDSLIQSTMLAETSSPASDEVIRSCLRKSVDLYLARLFPESQAFNVSLARGRTKYDRLGRQAAKKGDYPAALGYFIQAIDAQPDDHAALYNAAIISQAQGDTDSALKYLSRALKLAHKNEYLFIYQRIQKSINHNKQP